MNSDTRMEIMQDIYPGASRNNLGAYLRWKERQEEDSDYPEYEDLENEKQEDEPN